MANWLLLIKTHLLLHCPLHSNEKPKTIAALNLTREYQIVEQSLLLLAFLSSLLQAFLMLGSQVLLAQLIHLDKLSSVLLQVHYRLHFLTLQIVPVALFLIGVEAMFWLHKCLRPFETNIPSSKTCLTMIFFQSSLLQEMVKPPFFDTLPRMRLNL
jgi:hypothetical protein